jgi:hypothetical protein
MPHKPLLFSFSAAVIGAVLAYVTSAGAAPPMIGGWIRLELASKEGLVSTVRLRGA